MLFCLILTKIPIQAILVLELGLQSLPCRLKAEDVPMQIPIVMFLLTHAYFCFYHTISSMVIRRTYNAVKQYPTAVQHALVAVVVFVLAYVTAFMETFTISKVCNILQAWHFAHKRHVQT
jgi:hypothetical protein